MFISDRAIIIIMGKFWGTLLFVSALIAFLMPASAQAMQVFIDNDVYEVNSDMVVRVISDTVTNVSVTVNADNATEDLMDGFTINITETGAKQVTRSQSLNPGSYKMSFQQGASSMAIYFGIVDEILFPDCKLMGTPVPIVIDTSTAISNWNDVGGNFTDLLGLNLSEYIYYGNYSDLTGDGKTFHFVVVDDSVAGVYDTVYIDDDKNFQLFNDTEDNSSFPFLEASEGLEGMVEIDSNHRYIIADMDTSTGKDIYMIVPRNSSTFTSSDMLNMLDLLSYENDTIIENKTINITIYDENDVIVNTNLVGIGDDGYANASINLSGYDSGKYYIFANETPVDVFKVESFKLHARITDLSNNPISTFSPGSKAKVWAVSRNAAGDLTDLDAVPSGTLLLPGGTTSSLTFTSQSTGVYAAETATALTTTGEYKVTVSGSISSDTETFDTGFSVQSVTMEIMTLNPKYLDEGPGEGTMMSAFAPNSNVSAAVMLINASKGSAFKSGGPPCGSDGSSCIQTPCDNAQFDVVVRDDKGNRHELGNGNFTAMTIDAAASLMGVEGPPEPGMGDQCMLMIWDNNTWLSEAGNYKLEVGFSNSSIGDLESGASFSVQRLLAVGSTVDMRGDSFSFFAPNSTVRVKLEIRDMVTDELLNGSDILDARITEMWKEWPTRKNALKEMNFNKSQLNESLSGDKIIFTSPPEEGFYVAKFRFKADLDGTITEGTGMIFFELKKYMIWGDLESASEGNWYVKAGENIILTVSIMDIDMGSRYGEEGASVSCTGCEGLVANISSLRNEQFFKEMVEGVDYTITTGVVSNSTSGATINITPSGSGGTDLPSGWYGIDIILSDPDTGDTYYGWGGFEIRNFWVDVFEVELIKSGPSAGNYTNAGENTKGRGGVTVPVGGSVLLGVAAFQPPTPMSPPSPLVVSTVTSEGIMNNDFWPPLPVPESKYNITKLVGTNKMVDPWCDKCEPFEIKIVNVTVAGDMEESGYMLNLRVTTSGSGSDIGDAMITVSSYQVDYETIPESKMYEWPPVYATTENISMWFNVTEFDNSPHNITNVTVEDVFSGKAGRPVKFKHGQNYTNNCTGSTSVCVLDVYLSGLSPGEYFAMFEVTDANGAAQEVEYEFEIKNLLFAVPQIYEGWSWDSSTPDKELEAWYGEDRCDNERWLMHDKYAFTGTNKVTIELQQGVETNITLPENKIIGTDYSAGAFCVDKSDGEWRNTMSGSCTGGSTLVYVANNGTNTWINGSLDMSSTNMLSENSTFVLTDFSATAWVVQSLRPTETGYIRIKHAGGIICGRNELNPGDGIPVLVMPPQGSGNYTSFYHGPNSMSGDLWGGGDQMKEMLEIPNRSVYVYHNTSHLWIHNGIENVNFTNSSAFSGPYALGETVNDTYGGSWTLISLSKSRITLKGRNVLDNGIFVNTSLSTSGTIRIGMLEEQEMGFENKLSESKGGMDLDGDGDKDGTLYFVIIDQGNGYDTLIYSDSSTKWNFTNTSRMVNTSETDRSLRQVGNSDQLTLLSIDPRANSVKFYDPSAIGEWAELGDARIGENITIPVVVKSPDGTQVAANVSIPTLKRKTASGSSFVTTVVPAVEINGLGELTINVSDLGLGSGSYEFEIKAESNTYGTEYLNEWMWPTSVVRNFLVDISAGYGGITTDFAAVSATKYGGGESSGKVLELQTINETDGGCGNMTIQGIAAFVRDRVDTPWSNPLCNDYEEPANVNLSQNNYTYIVREFDNEYFIYVNQNVSYGNQTIWVKQDDCNFSAAQSYNISDQVNITLGTDLFMLYVLNITYCDGGNNRPYVFLGPTGIDSSSIEPVRMDDWSGNMAPRWFMTSINDSETGWIYDVVFANDTGLSYPQAATWGIDSPAKAVWMSTDGDFSAASKYRIGENFFNDKYVASLGPDAWSGLLIADAANNLTNLLGAGVYPGMDMRVADMQMYFGKIDEAASGMDLDLNMDGDKTDVFYSVAFDDFDDGIQKLTRIYVDDDLNMTEPWWADSNNPDSSSTYYDFYGNESGNISEQEGSPPSGMWGGNIRFGPENSSKTWEQLPSWNIKAYNGTDMIIEKDTWQLDKDRTISVTARVFDFAQNPLQGATVSLNSLMRFGGGQPFATLNASDDADFNITNTQNVTDSNGYGMIKFTPPPGGWLDNAEYIAEISVAYGGMTEMLREWFRIGGGEF